MSYHEETAVKVDRLLESGQFRARCEGAGVQPTRRQARKFLRGDGRAFRTEAAADGKFHPLPVYR